MEAKASETNTNSTRGKRVYFSRSLTHGHDQGRECPDLQLCLPRAMRATASRNCGHEGPSVLDVLVVMQRLHLAASGRARSDARSMSCPEMPGTYYLTLTTLRLKPPHFITTDKTTQRPEKPRFRQRRLCPRCLDKSASKPSLEPQRQAA